MRFLLLNQAFYPDVASSAQHLSDLACGLVERGHEVTVVAGRRAYDIPDKKFPRRETWRSIKIFRVASFGFGKRSHWTRLLDFGSFWICCALQLARLPRHDVVVALTSPPLISILGACYAALRRSRFYYWVMDLNPDEAIAAGWLRNGSPAAWLLELMSRLTLRAADKVIALDSFMAERIVAKGVPRARIMIIPPWSHDDLVRFDFQGRDSFRREYGLTGKFVVMYAGNHSPCHPLDTLLEAARRLAGDPSIVFCFSGGGSEWRKMRPGHLASNVRLIPYQPRESLSALLSAADLHVVVMGASFVGLVHPCKIYNILRVGTPLLYLGPESGPIAALIRQAKSELAACSARHGEVDDVVRKIKLLRRICPNARGCGVDSLALRFARASLLPRFLTELESSSLEHGTPFKPSLNTALDAVSSPASRPSHGLVR